MELTLEYSVVKEFDFEIKAPHLLAINDHDQLLIPMNIYNKRETDAYVSFNCSIPDGKWDLFCPIRYRVSGSSAGRSYVKLKVGV